MSDLDRRVNILEDQMDVLRDVPARLTAVESQIVQLRSEMQSDLRRADDPPIAARAGAAVTTLAGARASAQWQPSGRYPDPLVRIVDQSFARYRLALAKVEQIATGMRWCEGPVWFGDGRFLLWSDIPNNRIMKCEEETGAVSVFRRPSHNSNGLTRDRQGRLLTCEHDARRVTRTEYDGDVTVIADTYDGKPLNSPNDVVCRSDGSIWFTDPPFGILGFYEGHVAKPELPTNV